MKTKKVSKDLKKKFIRFFKSVSKYIEFECASVSILIFSPFISLVFSMKDYTLGFVIAVILFSLSVVLAVISEIIKESDKPSIPDRVYTYRDSNGDIKINSRDIHQVIIKLYYIEHGED